MKIHRYCCLVLLISLAGLSACGGGSSGNNPSSPHPTLTPSVSSISPSSATAGGSAFTLTVNGSNFASGAIVFWTNPSNLMTPVVRPATTFVSASQLTVQISGADIASPVTVQVNVENLNVAPTSNSVNFVINPGPAGGAKVISKGANGAAPNGSSFDPVLSSTGRFVAFSSTATNLIVPNTQFPEGYVLDTCLGADGCTPSTQLVSAVTGGSSEGNGQGGAAPSINNLGRFVGFTSTATNLVIPNTHIEQVYLRDTCAGSPGCTPITALASVKQTGGEPNGAATGFMIANNSCNAAFASSATDVVGGVTTPNEVYLTSCSANGPAGGFTTSGTLVSADNSGIPGNNQGSAVQPAISSDGRFVAFSSNQPNLPGAPGGGLQEIYVRDTCTSATSGCAPATTLVSVDSATGNPFAANSVLPSISDDGRFVVFRTDVPQVLGVKGIVSLRDTCNSSSGPVAGCTASTTTISVAANGTAANNTSSVGVTQHAISGDGRFVVFDSLATNLVNPATVGNQVFVRDTCKSSSGAVSGCTPRTVLISIDSKGNPTGGSGGAISDDGHFAAFVNETTIFQILFAATGF
jgi:WD40-like Beta Propeller Repeat